MNCIDNQLSLIEEMGKTKSKQYHDTIYSIIEKLNQYTNDKNIQINMLKRIINATNLDIEEDNKMNQYIIDEINKD